MGISSKGRDDRHSKGCNEGVCPCGSRPVILSSYFTTNPLPPLLILKLSQTKLKPQKSLVSVARGEQDYFSPEGIPTAAEGCKSNALMRCCKDLGVASELWDPRYIRKFTEKHVREAWVEHVVTKKRKKLYLRKDDVAKYPFKEVKGFAG